MTVKTGIILCAGLGKRLNPITLEKPKPLLKLNNITLLENTIQFIKELGVEKIFINTFYFKDQIKDYLKNHDFNISIEEIEDGENILDTGGGIKNIMNFTDEKNFFIFNPDTIWNIHYLKCIKEMEEFFKNSEVQNVLLVVNKKLSFDKKLNGDFNLNKNLLSKSIKNEFIYTGCQILSRELLNNTEKNVFSINEIWNGLIENNNLFGFESENHFLHVTDLEIYNRILKSY